MNELTTVSSQEAANLDKELFTHFSLQQLMELAGLSAAQASMYHIRSKMGF